MQISRSYNQESEEFIDKMKRIGTVFEGSFLVTANVFGLYPSMPQKEQISALKDKLQEQTFTSILTNDLIKLAEFVLKNIFFELNKKVKQQIYPQISPKFAPPYTSFYRDIKTTKKNFLKTHELQAFVWLR